MARVKVFSLFSWAAESGLVQGPVSSGRDGCGCPRKLLSLTIGFSFTVCMYVMSAEVSAMFVQVPTEAKRECQRPWNPNLLAVVRCQMWVLGTEFLSRRTGSALTAEPSLTPLGDSST